MLKLYAAPFLSDLGCILFVTEGLVSVYAVGDLGVIMCGEETLHNPVSVSFRNGHVSSAELMTDSGTGQYLYSGVNYGSFNRS